MKLWKMGWMLVVASVVMAGCLVGDIDDDTCAQDADCGPGRQCEKATGQCVVREDRNLLCTTSADCLSSETCHPTAKVCVRICRASADCPDATKVCDVVSATDSTKVCQCATDALCNQERQNAGLVCSSLDKVCTPRCAADADCGSGRTCDKATGQCKKAETLRCQGDTDCLASEICHPSAKVCVQTCVSGVDCPSSAKTCEVLSTTDSRKVCKCSTDTLCNIDRNTPDLVCSRLDRVCTPKCTADVECGAGQICDTAARHCKVRGDTGGACMGEGQSNCNYGTHFCSTNQCTALPVPGCINYTNFSSKGSLGTTATILYGARVVSAATDTAACGTTTPKRVKIALSAYSSVPFPSTKEGLNGFFLVRSNGSSVSGIPLVFSGSDYTVSGANRERAEIVVSLCFDSASVSASTAFYFTGGNFLCFQANY